MYFFILLLIGSPLLHDPPSDHVIAAMTINQSNPILLQTSIAADQIVQLDFSASYGIIYVNDSSAFSLYLSHTNSSQFQFLSTFDEGFISIGNSPGRLELIALVDTNVTIIAFYLNLSTELWSACNYDFDINHLQVNEQICVLSTCEDGHVSIKGDIGNVTLKSFPINSHFENLTVNSIELFASTDDTKLLSISTSIDTDISLKMSYRSNSSKNNLGSLKFQSELPSGVYSNNHWTYFNEVKNEPSYPQIDESSKDQRLDLGIPRKCTIVIMSTFVILSLVGAMAIVTNFDKCHQNRNKHHPLPPPSQRQQQQPSPSLSSPPFVPDLSCLPSLPTSNLDELANDGDLHGCEIIEVSISDGSNPYDSIDTARGDCPTYV